MMCERPPRSLRSRLPLTRGRLNACNTLFSPSVRERAAEGGRGSLTRRPELSNTPDSGRLCSTLSAVKMNAGITGHTIFPQIVFLANIFLDLAIRIPRHIESNFPWSGVCCRVIDRGFIVERVQVRAS